MKRRITVLLMVLLVLALTACGGSSAPSVSDEPKPVQQTTPAPMETAPSAEAPAQQASEGAPAPEPRSETSEVLVVYFSATGTTRGVAEKLAALTGADTYEIIAAEPYSNADLNWNDRNSRTTLEQNDKSVRPGIGSEAIDLSGYTTVYIGYPIWWGEEPRIMDTFYLFLRSGMADYILFRVPFAFLDYDKAAWLVFLENLLMLLFWAFLGAACSSWLRKNRRTEKPT